MDLHAYGRKWSNCIFSLVITFMYLNDLQILFGDSRLLLNTRIAISKNKPKRKISLNQILTVFEITIYK